MPLKTVPSDGDFLLSLKTPGRFHWSSQERWIYFKKFWNIGTKCKWTFLSKELVDSENIFLEISGSNMDGPRGYHMKWSSQTEKDKYISFRSNLKAAQMELFMKQEQSLQTEETSFWLPKGEAARDRPGDRAE